MDPANATDVKVVALHPGQSEEDFDIPTARVAFPDDHVDIHEEKLQHVHIRPRGPEMKREMTKEEKELAAAGYGHLEERKAKGNKEETSELDSVGIEEHRLRLDQLGDALETAIDTKDPGASYGLTTEQAKDRLARFGANILTPPKKKSALQVVSHLLAHGEVHCLE